MSALLERAQGILERAHGDEQIEVYLSEGTDTEVLSYQCEIESLTTASSAMVSVRLLQDGPSGARVGSAWAGALDDDSIARVIADARDNLRFATEDEYLTFARPDGVSAAELQLVDPQFSSTSLDDKIQMAIDLERAVRDGDRRIRQVDSAGYSDYIAQAAIASSTGIAAAYERSGASLSTYAIANDGHDDETGWGLSVGRSARELSVSEAATDAITRATRMLGAVKAPTMRGVAVFDPRTAATLISIIASALSGDAVVRGRSFFADRLGEEVAARSFTLVDDPTDARHYSASTYDGEGLACRRNVLIEDGVLRQFVYDTTSARRAGAVSTGSATRSSASGTVSASCRALLLSSGPFDQAEILRQVGEGFFIESLSGIHSGVNPISGDFSVGVTGLMIRDGQLAEPIREVTVASTLQRMLLDVLHIGSDVEWLPGSAAGQTLAVDGVALSGS